MSEPATSGADPTGTARARVIRILRRPGRRREGQRRFFMALFFVRKKAVNLRRGVPKIALRLVSRKKREGANQREGRYATL